ncbi:molybdenum cofactor biosynthesis protein MoaE [Rhodospirillaceae bacterium AH-315-P19]|nr:molybdenum cofactor biosynthesis protein MoaE [Rhodospirillaceae bacterium AH-315-P19]
MIRVQRQRFDVNVEIEKLTSGNPKIGGVATFIGFVRNESQGDAVTAMTLEHYPGMTEKKLEEIEAEANRRWPLEGSLIVHRYGKLELGEAIVLVATASAHRQAAFESCQFLMDWLKTQAPFWKQEETVAGKRWVEACNTDTAAAQNWEKKDPESSS